MPGDFRVLFIYPNTQMATLVPINISLLSACLRDKGFTVDLFDSTFYRIEEISFEERKVELLQLKPFNWKERGVFYMETDIRDDIRRKVADFRPDLIGITLVEDTYELGLSLLDAVKDCPAPVIAGGVFVTFCADEVIANENIDMVCVGEGEEALVELCERMCRNEDPSSIRNIWVKKDGKVLKNPMRKLVDVNAAPFIDYDIFGRQRLLRPMQGKIRTMIHVEIDRGCPYECTYCEAPALRRLFKESGCGAYHRKKSVDRIISEMRHLVEKYSPDYINFNSETFLVRPIAEFRRLAQEYARHIGLPFWCQTRPETVTDEKVGLLKDMNCSNMQFGIEHGNEAFRAKVLNRHHSNEQMLKAFRIVEKRGMVYTVNNILGFPDETRELVFDTINFNRQINPVTINCYMFTPYKGTSLYRLCVEKGYLAPDAKVHQALDGAPLKMDSITYQELKGLQRTFSLYARLPESEFPEIRKAEKFDEEGNAAFESLSAVYHERFFK